MSEERQLSDREQEEQRIIGENIRKLIGLDVEAYPALAAVFRRAATFRAHICRIWEYIQQHPTPVGRDNNGNGNGYTEGGTDTGADSSGTGTGGDGGTGDGGTTDPATPSTNPSGQ